MEKVAKDLQQRLGEDDLCSRSVYSGIQGLLWEFGKFACAEAVTDGGVYHCATFSRHSLIFGWAGKSLIVRLTIILYET
jgi:hypothetical protein